MATVDWTADANEALTLSLGGLLCNNSSITNAFRAVRAEEDKQVLGGEERYEEFHPTFTYPVCFYFYLITHSPVIPCHLSRYTERTKRFMAIKTW
jgi:hypothetical protein